MTLRLKIGIALVSALVVALPLAFGAADSLFSPSAEELVESFAPTTLFILCGVFWVWMVADHIVVGGSSHTVLVSLFLVLGGGVAAIIYFFAVFRPREIRAQERLLARV
ncbi:MAG: hypothetical protein J0L88_06985 [Xanthomonadales bacterium]|nr:hypothetical protein [Xanthomonadales bacterium]